MVSFEMFGIIISTAIIFSTSLLSYFEEVNFGCESEVLLLG